MRISLLIVLFCFTINSAIGQTCIKSFKIENSGGQGGPAQDRCPDPSASVCPGFTTLTGVISITLFEALPTGVNPPTITSVFGIENGVETQLSFCFRFRRTSDRQTLEYCYYGTSTSNNLTNGGQPNYRFNISYTNTTGGSQTCIVPKPGEEAPNPNLPVTFKYFNAKRNNNTVALTWETASESNNSGFDVQRKQGGGNEWESVTFIPTKARGGNSSEILTYQYTDVNNRGGITQYRLKQVDFDKKVAYSDIRSVRGEAQTGQLLIYPNPSLNGTVTIAFEETNTLRSVFVTDASGRRVKEFAKTANNTLVINDLQNGIYNVHITDLNAAETRVERIIIKKR